MTLIPYGRFLLLERVAIGGMAEVWAAVERGDPGGRLRAIKRILPTLVEEQELVRREWRRWRRDNADSIEAYNRHVTDHQPFLKMLLRR